MASTSRSQASTLSKISCMSSSWGQPNTVQSCWHTRQARQGRTSRSCSQTVRQDQPSCSSSAAKGAVSAAVLPCFRGLASRIQAFFMSLSPEARSYPGRTVHGSADDAHSDRPAHRCWTPPGSSPAPAPGTAGR